MWWPFEMCVFFFPPFHMADDPIPEFCILLLTDSNKSYYVANTLINYINSPQ